MLLCSKTKIETLVTKSGCHKQVQSNLVCEVILLQLTAKLIEFPEWFRVLNSLLALFPKKPLSHLSVVWFLCLQSPCLYASGVIALHKQHTLLVIEWTLKMKFYPRSLSSPLNPDNWCCLPFFFFNLFFYFGLKVASI